MMLILLENSPYLGEVFRREIESYSTDLPGVVKADKDSFL
jgi:hypothetical protein